MVTIAIKDSQFSPGGRFADVPRNKANVVIPSNRPTPSYIGAKSTEDAPYGSLNMVITCNPLELPDERFYTLGPSGDGNVNNIIAVLAHLVRQDIIEVRKNDVVLTPEQIVFFEIPGKVVYP